MPITRDGTTIRCHAERGETVVEGVLLSEGRVRRAEEVRGGRRAKGSGGATIGPILMQFVPSCRRWGQICHAVRVGEENVPLSEGSVPHLPFPGQRIVSVILGTLRNNFGSSWVLAARRKRKYIFQRKFETSAMLLFEVAYSDRHYNRG